MRRWPDRDDSQRQEGRHLGLGVRVGTRPGRLSYLEGTFQVGLTGVGAADAGSTSSPRQPPEGRAGVTSKNNRSRRGLEHSPPKSFVATELGRATDEHETASSGIKFATIGSMQAATGSDGARTTEPAGRPCTCSTGRE